MTSDAAPHDAPATSTGPGDVTSGDHGPGHPFLSCLLPLVVFLGLGALEPTGEGGLAGMLGLRPEHYPVVYTLRIVASLVALAVVARDVLPWLGRPSWWPPLLGAALVVPWIILAGLQREAGWAGIGGRAAFDPFSALADSPDGGWAFLAVRFTGLVLVVPIAEELFLRGFLMRYVVNERFWEVPFGTLTTASAVACTAYAVLTHPGEAIAAAGWFGIVSGIAASTRRPIDCITAHAATNLALGFYVVATGAWWLW